MTMTAATVRQRIKAVRCWLLDMDGTITLGESLLPGTAAFFDSLTARGDAFYLMTNNSSRDKAYYGRRMQRLGLPVRPDQIRVSTDVLVAYINQQMNRPARVFALGTPAFEAELHDAGIQITHQADQAIDWVVVAFDTSLTYEKLTTACNYIRSGVPYLATHPDLICPMPDQRVLPDCGALVACLKACSGVAPARIVGKPQTDLVDQLLAEGIFKREELAMVGDRLYTDMAMAQAAGLFSVLVLSGESKRGDKRAPFKPDLIVDDIGVLARLLATNG